MLEIEQQVSISRAFHPGENPEHVRDDGDVLPRTCMARMAVSACADCIYYNEYSETANQDKICSERNLIDVVSRQGLEMDDVLLVSVTANGIGFYDELTDDKVTINEFGGYEQTKGYNAFFARSSEKKALAGRLADCGFVAIDFEDKDGEQVNGFIHITRTNMQGIGSESFGVGDEKHHFVREALLQAAEHYGVEVADMKLNLAAAIDKLVYKFKSTDELTAEQNMDKLFAGWFDMGLLQNTANPNWQRGDEINPDDVWEADYHAMCEHLLKTSGVEESNIDLSSVLNPGDSSLGHASNAAGKHGKRPEARDLYLVSTSRQMNNFNKAAELMLMGEIANLPLEKGLPKIDEDPFVSLYEVRMGHASPPKELWDTPENREAAQAQGLHPMTYWLIGSEVPSDPVLSELYDEWVLSIIKL